MSVTQTYTGTVVVLRCCSCGVPFGMDQDFHRRRTEDREWFYCPAGHPQHFTGPSEAQRLKGELERKQRELHETEQRNAALHEELYVQKNKTKAQKAAKTRLKRRVMNGVCPCCNRSFSNLKRHMESQHPDQTIIESVHPVHKKINSKTKQ